MVGILKKLFYSLFIVPPLLMSSQTSEMFEFNKMLFIYLISVIVFGLWCIHYIVRRPQLYLPKIVLIPLVIFVISMIASTFQSIDPHTSLFGYYGRWNGGLISIISFIVLFFVFIQVFTKEHVHTLLKISLVASAIVMLWGFLAKFGLDLSCLVFVRELSNTCWTAQFQPSIRMFSTLGQPNWLGSYLAIHFFIALYYFLNSYPLLKDHESTLDKMRHVLSKFHLLKESHPFGRHLFYVVYLIFNFLAIYFTKSRSSLLAVGLMLLVGGIVVVTSRIAKTQRSWVRLTAIVILFSAVMLLVNARTFSLDEKLPENLEITDSFEIRKIVWSGAVDLGKKYPFLGTGPETFAYSYFFTKPVEHNNTSEWDFVYNKAHNEYLNYLATTGYIGLLGYMAFLGSAGIIFISYAKKYHADEQVIFMLALGYGTILITNFFGFSTSTIQLFLFLIPAMVVVFNQKEPVDIEIEDIHNSTLQSKLIIVGIIVSSVLCVSYLQRYHKADRLFKQAKDQIYQDEYQKAVLLLTRAIKLKYEHVYEDQLSSSLAHLAFISSFGEDGRTRSLNLLKLSNDANAHTLRKIPKNIQYWKTRAKNHYLYFQVTRDVADLERSVESMQHVISLAPNDVQSYYMLGLFYSVLAQETGEDSYKAKAIESTQTSLKLRPCYIDAKELLDRSL
ncbi:hypothetical protein CO051_01290 [Candidatus Roizmanbacteria bacterium CG_4_9_14_0_2_um_filter_39_13]|uniref:O-antigen ligase-related domain-containing protein n=2 Tax=Candidatus Roizmaniibacteriota TaxID=1752723 RepID=A0A2M8F2Y0_9BACT|nr:MAG: hypothetical protein CO051_01290 [Candidatus Roizmanbacteria bacterium CG_4_9_14_0_2_um_filter_39_13]PJE61735.1 MAG: hypothetical protein COU87_03010 [Candidatus Roizmanbacteria bacterium CG10_big_fil_rev_8_21_14_0_10_39_12]